MSRSTRNGIEPLELRVANGANDPTLTPHTMAEAYHSWIREAAKMLDGGIAGQAFKIDFDRQDGFFVHTVLIVENPAFQQVAEPMQALTQLWYDTMHHKSAYVFNCKSSATSMEYRGLTDTEWWTPLREELHNAAVYLVATDTLYRFIFLDADSMGFGDPLALTKQPGLCALGRWLAPPTQYLAQMAP